jgi:hypothetical protein
MSQPSPEVGKVYFLQHQRRTGEALVKCVFVMGTMATFIVREGSLVNGLTAHKRGDEITVDMSLISLRDRRAHV